MDLVSIQDVAISVSETFKFKGENIVFLNTGDIYDGKILNFREISPVGLPGQAKKSIKEDDILFSEIRPINRRFAFVNFKVPNYVVSTKLMVIRTINPKILPKYLFYFLTSDPLLRHLQLMAESRSGTFPQITFSEIKNIKIFVPDIGIQKSIVFCLDSINNLIENKKSENFILEKIALAIFKSWFVDFDPIRAKMEGRESYSIDTEIAALFPDWFEASALGEIPKGWIILPLDQVADFLNGLALQKYPPEDDESLPVIKIAELKRGVSESSDKASPKIEKKYIVEDGDVIFSWSGSLEVVIWCGGKGALNQHLFKVTSSKYPKWFYYQWTKYHLSEFQAIAAGKATTMGHIQRHHLSAAYTIIPSENLLSKMDKIMAPLFDLIINNEKEIQSLAAIRDSLLPKLLSGEIRVKDTEKYVEAHV